MAQCQKTESAALKLKTVRKDAVPKGREGKHKRIVTLLLNRLSRLPSGSALKVPLDQLPDSKAKIRAALSRATRQSGVSVATSSDSTHLYLWKADRKP